MVLASHCLFNLLATVVFHEDLFPFRARVDRCLSDFSRVLSYHPEPGMNDYVIHWACIFYRSVPLPIYVHILLEEVIAFWH